MPVSVTQCCLDHYNLNHPEPDNLNYFTFWIRPQRGYMHDTSTSPCQKHAMKIIYFHKHMHIHLQTQGMVCTLHPGTTG